VTAKTALVTGCSTGIGRATAVELTTRGYDVIATARRPKQLEGLDVARTLGLDVDSDASVAEALTEVGDIDVLVNNAGFGIDGAVETVPLADVRRAFETNFFGAARMIQAFLPSMRERGAGVIVNVSSVAGVAAGPLSGYYSASKFALEALSESLHFEVGHFGVRVIIIEPGSIETSFGANVVDFRDEPGPYQPLASIWRGGMERLSGGRAAPGPELVARAIADALASDDRRLRVPVGADAEMVTTARNGATFDEFEAAMRAFLKIDW
jgi:NAD(P)-dependent dehydrogenase (short-subunit alcohol dehydrogenase family)